MWVSLGSLAIATTGLMIAAFNSNRAVRMEEIQHLERRVTQLEMQVEECEARSSALLADNRRLMTENHDLMLRIVKATS